MKKVIYKDEVFWYKTKIAQRYPLSNSKLIIYKQRKGFLSSIFKYRKIKTYKSHPLPGGNDDFRKRNVIEHWIEKFLDGYTEQREDYVILLKCSKEVIDLYS